MNSEHDFQGWKQVIHDALRQHVYGGGEINRNMVQMSLNVVIYCVFVQVQSDQYYKPSGT